MKLFTLLPSTLSSPQGHPVLGCDDDVVRRGFFCGPIGCFTDIRCFEFHCLAWMSELE